MLVSLKLKKKIVNPFRSKVQTNRIISIRVSLQNHVLPMFFCLLTVA